ncbi:hypothetical protein [Vagococcus carniphilus]|uniref:hypothetical protein n=1 Tax=Vagococcus carniphilus TaxID=218144 RepID=UPI00288DCD57|nr:hypothetical protein [Vagococcus carniphilus]MDT2864681.1 hypothetical protein [Vagococcus carniphilus]
MYKKFNINKSIKVKLTRHGIAVYKERYANIGLTDVTVNIDDEGYSKFQMHDLMSIFGSSMYMGGNLPFQTEILIEESPKEESAEKTTVVLSGNYVRFIDKEGKSFYQVSDLKDIPNPSLNDTALCKYGLCQYNGKKWMQVLGG